MPVRSPSDWKAFLTGHPDAHLFQTGSWGELKSFFEWDVTHIIVDGKSTDGGDTVGAQVLFRSLPFGFSLAYIPKGPLGPYRDRTTFSGWKSLWPEVDALCQKRRAVFLKVEPDLWETGEDNLQRPDSENIPPGFRIGQQDIQPRRTIVIDISGDDEQIVAGMKQKTRYNVRLALKKGVEVYPSTDLEAFYRLMTITGERDQFGVHNLAYYRKAYDLFYPRGECELLMAAYQDEPLAGLMVFARGRRAWYFYGASDGRRRNLMPNYLLQWEAMRWARSRGCILYDLWGVPDFDQATLEADFTKRSNGLWGVYRFKRGFGGELRRAVASWDRVYQPVPYVFYRWWLNRKVQSG